MDTIQTAGMAVWQGTASYKGLVYDVAVLAPADAWKRDIVSAVNKARGFNVDIEESKCPDSVIDTTTLYSALEARVTYLVKFTPNPRLTDNCVKMGLKPITFPLNSFHGIMRDGTFQEALRTLRTAKTQGNLQPIMKRPLPYNRP